jgi:hypothetical protein
MPDGMKQEDGDQRRQKDRERKRRYYWNHREELQEQMRERYRANREDVLEKARQRRRQNRESTNAYNRKYYYEHLEQMRAYNRERKKAERQEKKERQLTGGKTFAELPEWTRRYYEEEVAKYGWGEPRRYSGSYRPEGQEPAREDADA